MEIITTRRTTHYCAWCRCSRLWLNQGRFITKDAWLHDGVLLQEGKREHAVGFILDKIATKKSFLGFNPINNRIITLRLQDISYEYISYEYLTCSGLCSYIYCFRPGDGTWRTFMVSFKTHLTKIPNKDMLVIMGDWNAKIGKCDAKSKIIGE